VLDAAMNKMMSAQRALYLAVDFNQYEMLIIASSMSVEATKTRDTWEKVCS
jgi:hypothetical protein